jgi:hypothetical protein
VLERARCCAKRSSASRTDVPGPSVGGNQITRRGCAACASKASRNQGSEDPGAVRGGWVPAETPRVLQHRAGRPHPGAPPSLAVRPGHRAYLWSFRRRPPLQSVVNTPVRCGREDVRAFISGLPRALKGRAVSPTFRNKAILDRPSVTKNIPTQHQLLAAGARGEAGASGGFPPSTHHPQPSTLGGAGCLGEGLVDKSSYFLLSPDGGFALRWSRPPSDGAAPGLRTTPPKTARPTSDDLSRHPHLRYGRQLARSACPF